jgi:hypothetical protein
VQALLGVVERSFVQWSSGTALKASRSRGIDIPPHRARAAVKSLFDRV